MKQLTSRSPRSQLLARSRRSAADLSAIFDAIADAVFVYDPLGRIVQMNDAAAKFAQWDTHKAYLTVPLNERSAGMEMHDESGRPLTREEWPATRVLRGERFAGPTALDIRARTPDGHELILSISGAPLLNRRHRLTGAVCVIRDVTARRRMEHELAERASEIEGAFESLADGIVTCDLDGNVVRTNDAHRRLMGYDLTREPEATHVEDYAPRYGPRDAEGKPLAKEDWPIIRILRGETLTGANAVDMRIRTLDGRELYLQVSGAPVRDANGHIIGAVSATRDFTERRQLEQQRSDILRVVAHDLMGPVTGMRLYLYTQQRRLLKGMPPFVPDEALLTALDTNLLRMERLVNDLREMASIESGALALERDVCDLAGVCRQEIDVQRLLAPTRAIRLDAPEEPLMAEVDGQRVGQIVANFLTNALKYSPTDSQVTLTIQRVGDSARIAVRDAGPGIPPDEITHIWERFHRVEGVKANNGAQSLGLGLYICRAIVERHGGQIGVESVVGAGSTFWCELPLAAPDSGDAHTPAKSSANA